LADIIRRGDLEGFMQCARAKETYIPLAQGAIDLALSGVTSLAEVMAVGSGLEELDRKSTRLNSSHLVISYAVFCLKKKKNSKYKRSSVSRSRDRRSCTWPRRTPARRRKL